MHFRRVVLESFQSVQRAAVDFAPGLNVLFGPNDLGKSTLAAGIRAALLVQPGAAEAARYSSWYADASPKVSLDLVDDEGRFWRVAKTFGDGGSAELHFSKDGLTFVLDCKARQVEEKVRALLGWGVPAPGGRGAPRGVPNTFLANTLLAAQTDVDAVLGASLVGDPDSSGRIRLSKALATLAQDPLFKKVLDAAQREVDQCFTRTGRRSTSQTSRFTEASDRIKTFQRELEALKHQREESEGVEQHVSRLRQRRSEALVCLAEARASLAELSERLAGATLRAEAQARLDVARDALRPVEELAKRVDSVAADIERLSKDLEQRASVAAGAAGAATDAAGELLRAEEAYRVATSEDSARQRELRRAQLSEEAAQAVAAKQAGLAAKGIAEVAIKARKEVDSRAGVCAEARREVERCRRELSAAADLVTASDRAHAEAQALVAFGRWRARVQSDAEGAVLREAVVECRVNAEAKSRRARDLEIEAAQIESATETGLARLPSEASLKELLKLERQLEVAEAALGGGLSVTLRPRQPLNVRVAADQGSVEETELASERAFAADRAISVSIGNVVDIEIIAGAADQRRQVDTLRRERSLRVVPALDAAGLPSLQVIAETRDGLQNQRTGAVGLRRDASQLVGESKSLLETATAREQRAAQLSAAPAELEALREAIGAADLEKLETRLAAMGHGAQSVAEQDLNKASKKLSADKERLARTEQALRLAEFRLGDAEVAVAEAERSLRDAIAPIAGDPDAAFHAAEETVSVAEQKASEIAAATSALAAEATETDALRVEIQSRQRRVDDAKAVLEAALDAQGRVRDELRERTGELTALRAQIAAANLEALRAAVAQRFEELKAFPEEPPVTEEQLAVARRVVDDASRALDEVTEDLHRNEGALTKVGGAAVAEELARVEEALQSAVAYEHELEIDADAWLLLRDTLRDVENEEGAHLGRALGGPVSARFSELTGGRYGEVRLDAGLKTETVGVGAPPGDDDVLRALSVGTRGQLATIVRLTIASQLKAAIILDDHLVNTDRLRLGWFRDVLLKTAVATQVIVLTCRPEDYLLAAELPDGVPVRDLAGGTIRAIDAARLLQRYPGSVSQGVAGDAAPV